MSLTPREQEIVALLRDDPTITSEQIARRLETSREAVNVHLSNLGKKGVIAGRGYILDEERCVVVVGGCNLDVKARSIASILAATSNPGHSSMTPGGVARNVAENLARLGTRTHLVSMVGRDDAGDGLLRQAAAAGVHLDHVHRTDLATGSYVALLDHDGELVAAVSDMAATERLAPGHVDQARSLIATARLLVLDANLSPATLARAIEVARAAEVRTILDPVSVPKAARLADQFAGGAPLFAVTPNRDELAALTGLPTAHDDDLQLAADRLHERGVQHVWVRLGARGSLFSSTDGTAVYLAPVPTTVEDVTGAGDAMLAAFCHGLLAGESPVAAARRGHAAAAVTIASAHTVRPDLSARLVDAALATASKEPTP